MIKSIDNLFGIDGNFKLNSYRDIFQRSIKSKSIKSLVVYDEKKTSLEYIKKGYTHCDYDDCLNIDDIENYEISTSCREIEFLSKINQISIDKISRSNIKSIEFSGKLDLVEGRLPLNIRSIKSKRHIDESRLPLNLKKLTYPYIDSENAIDALQLPRSLTSLSCLGAPNHQIDIRSLPPNLKRLTYYNSITDTPSSARLPLGLTNVSISSHWLKYIADLKSIEILQIKILDEHRIKPGDIPSCVTHLILSNRTSYKTITTDIIPKKVKYLRINGEFEFQANIFTEFQQLETLDITTLYNNNLVLGNLPESLTDLSLPYNSIDYPLDQYVTLPSGLQRLDLGGYKGEIPEMPSSLKTLRVRENTAEQPVTIPSSVETIHFRKVAERGKAVTGGKEDWPSSLTSISTSGTLPLQLSKSINRVTYYPGICRYTIQRLNETSFLVYGLTGTRFVAFISNWETIRNLLHSLDDK
ncbi:hypothetical protein PPL_01640 [Heterostelium album PN500]|uniref:FNIP repeat-containing protein n=1 Tax=Heterostelium pallidum (strain ATCC 26659 / Pp 5 / PN500) TaxID=670386 RepID=D3B026_HETP5|nr:hypothetical protein PPL_01640 [Heterostelium album PN500]EFA84650.1 hypothetical protein PPL_01640 [Heterostelium album PN500]|eukprot:XP_020436763.1 hypothetical protein PPL_01640 [Heterostelium album PN500]